MVVNKKSFIMLIVLIVLKKIFGIILTLLDNVIILFCTLHELHILNWKVRDIKTKKYLSLNTGTIKVS